MTPKSIYKFALSIEDEQILKMPIYSYILSIAEQDNQIVLYAIVNPMETEKLEERIIRIIGTGHTFTSTELINMTFIGTVKLHNGALMFHVFEKREK